MRAAHGFSPRQGAKWGAIVCIKSGSGEKRTLAIIDVARPLGIAVHDHIIVGKHRHASLKGLKLM
jgi:hypothetical protein